MNMPFLKSDGTLVIPFDAPKRYLWWDGGQTAPVTREELGSVSAAEMLLRRVAYEAKLKGRISK